MNKYPLHPTVDRMLQLITKCRRSINNLSIPIVLELNVEATINLYPTIHTRTLHHDTRCAAVTLYVSSCVGDRRSVARASVLGISVVFFLLPCAFLRWMHLLQEFFSLGTLSAH